MRLAGTASQYSKKAMPQPASTAAHSGAALKRRLPYQAKVMKTLETSSSRIGAQRAIWLDIALSFRRRLGRGQLGQHPPAALRQGGDDTAEGSHLLLGHIGLGQRHPQVALHRRALLGRMEEAGLVQLGLQLFE